MQKNFSPVSGQSGENFEHPSGQKPRIMDNFVTKSMRMHIGEKIKEAMQASGHSYKDMAEALGVARQNISYIVQKDDVDIKRLALISRITNRNLVKEIMMEFELDTIRPKRGMALSENEQSTEIKRLKQEKEELLQLLRATATSFLRHDKFYREGDRYDNDVTHGLASEE